MLFTMRSYFELIGAGKASQPTVFFAGVKKNQQIWRGFPFTLSSRALNIGNIRDNQGSVPSQLFQAPQAPPCPAIAR